MMMDRRCQGRCALHILARIRKTLALLDQPGTRLIERPAGEFEIAINRALVSIVVAIYLGTLNVLAGIVPPTTMGISAVYVGLGLALLAHIRSRPGRSPIRRYVGLCLDIAALSYALVVLGPYTAPLFPMYYWIILGNAFRYGTAYLLAASTLSVSGFSLVAVLNPYWASQPFLAAGVVGSLVIIPLYTAALSRKLYIVTEKLHTSVKSKSVILSTISHELRVPLAAVIDMNTLLQGTGLSRGQQEIVDSVSAAARAALSELDDLLNVSRLEAEQMPVALTTFSIPGLVREVSSLVELGAYTKDLQVSSYIAARTPLWGEADRYHLRKILINLATNAVKFTEVGSVLISVDATPGDSGMAVLRVVISDTGIGMDPASRARVFDSFAQANAEVLHRFGGVGLGLTVARQLVQLLGGSIGMDSNPDGGSSFHVEVPLRPVHLAGQEGTSLRGVAVAILTQEPVRLHGFRARLEKLGAIVSVTDNAEQLHTALTSNLNNVRHAAMMLDAERTEPSALARAVRRSRAFANIPLILLAGSDGLPPRHLQQQFVTAITAGSSDEELIAALQIAGPLPELPAEPASMEPSPVSDAPRLPQKLCVLVADDNRVSQVVLERLLTDAGHSVTLVSDGEQALEAILASDFDVALLDADMPVITGVDATQILRHGAPDVAALPVIGMTSDRSTGVTERCISAGMNMCLVKPVTRACLDNALSTVVPAPVPTSITAEGSGRARDPGVAEIASHPLFRGRAAGAKGNEHTYLFSSAAGVVPEMPAAFARDTDAILHELRVAARDNDQDRFRSQIGKLQATAASAGAGRLEAVCLARAALGGAGHQGSLLEAFARICREVDRARRELGERG